MSTVIKAVNPAYGTPETRPFWKVRLIAIVLVFADLDRLGQRCCSSVVFGGPLGDAIADAPLPRRPFDLVWAILRWPIAFVAVLLFFALVYYLAPAESAAELAWVSPGSIVGGLAWLALSGLFALYTSFSGSYNETYGSIAGGIVLLLWLNYSRIRAPVRRGAQRGARPAGRHPGRGRPERRPRQAVAAAPLADAERAAHLSRVRVADEPVRARPEPQRPRDRAAERNARLPVHARPDQVEVVRGRAVADRDPVRARSDLSRNGARRRAHGDAEARADRAGQPLRAGGGVVTGGVPTLNCPRIVVECGSQTNR